MKESYSTMLLGFLLAFLAQCAGQALTPTCSDGPAAMTFEPVLSTLGRYTVNYCTKPTNISKEWKLEIYYSTNQKYCNRTTLQRSGWPHHSTNFEWVYKHNCTGEQTACLSANFDLIFSACYVIGSTFLEDFSKPRSDFYFNVTNNYTEEFFQQNVVIVDRADYENITTITWHTGIPLSNYTMDLCNHTNYNYCRAVKRNCTVLDAMTLRCALQPPPNCYHLILKHVAPWIGSIFSKQEIVTFDFCRNETSILAVSGVRWDGWALGGAGGAAALGAAALLARALCRRNARRKLKEKVQASWLINSNRSSDDSVGAKPIAPTKRNVLLLYAREGPLAEGAMRALVELLEECVTGELWDIQSARVTALAAAAPGAWLRAALAQPSTAVLLLQSPALHALYRDSLGDRHKLEGPLLGRHVAARAPAFGDVLLLAALRHVAELPRSQSNYHKYYIATISGLASEVMPCVVPYRRYALPAGAALLLAHVGARPAPPARLQRLADQLRDFVHRAGDRPDYLLDELLPLHH